MCDGNTATAPDYTTQLSNDLASQNGELSIARQLTSRRGRASTDNQIPSNQQRQNYENAPMGGTAPVATSSISKTLLGV